MLLLCTCPSQASADLISEQLLERRLAACINQLAPVRSVYRWQGKIERASEIQLIIKSRISLFADIEQRILALHPYETPELLMLPITGGHTPYLAWLMEETS
ncbi:divalent-cation tolerance protein CutA [Aeromonas molluscorum 848]|uniref:Divalent-cation tolerance protein CutA n=2 Tax=Aeromonas molluscorum TaxID=271417 RepID=R1F4A7_9GAMM|nr:divalent-cation tolerance protein CutA [Aeromonas molluscorum 848]